MQNELEKYEPLSNGTQCNELKIAVDYSLGGMNYFTGDQSRRGYYAYITPVSRAGSFISSRLMGKTEESGFKICLETTQRKSQKRLLELWQMVEKQTAKIKELFEQKQYGEINKLIKGI